MTDVRSARAAAEALSQAVESEGFSGWDPYDALSSPVVSKLARTGVLRQLAIQALKEMPFNARPLLRIPKREHTKALALFTSAYARLASLGDPHARSLAPELAERLSKRSLPVGDGIGWGYDFDVQTRWGYYRRGQPNGVVTTFAAHAFLDLADIGETAFREQLAGVLRFAVSDLLVETGDGRFFGYFPGSRMPIHNANLLVASVFARAGDTTGEQMDAARAALEYSLTRQRPDGSWPYGEGRFLGWTDGYHTAYMLRCLAWWDGLPDAPSVRPAISAGLDLYLTRLIDSDGAPRATLRFRYPLDIHAAASAVWVLSELRDYDPRALPTAGRVLDWALRSMRRRDGHFAFQRHRLFRNAMPYVRWSDGHMLLALAAYLTAVGAQA